MSKSIAIRALLGTLVLLRAGRRSDDDPGHRGRDSARSASRRPSPNTYELAVGTLALLQVRADRGDMVLAYAVPLDKWGQPDFGRLIFLVEPQTVDATGTHLKFFTVPAVAAGMTFRVQAIAYDPMAGT